MCKPSACYAGGRGFESRPLRQNTERHAASSPMALFYSRFYQRPRRPKMRAGSANSAAGARSTTSLPVAGHGICSPESLQHMQELFELLPPAQAGLQWGSRSACDRRGRAAGHRRARASVRCGHQLRHAYRRIAESPRLLRGLKSLRGVTQEEVEQVLTRGP